MKLLIATDGSDHAFHAAQRCSRLPFVGPIELHLMTVIYFPPEDTGGIAYAWLPEFIAAEEERARASFARIEALFDDVEVVTHHQISHGHVGHTITEEANRIQADLLVIGARGHSTISRVLLGSTSDFVATQAQCSVLAVRPEHAAAVESDESNPDESKIVIAYDGSEPSVLALKQFAGLSWGRQTELHLVHVLSQPSRLFASADDDLAQRRNQASEDLNRAVSTLDHLTIPITTHVLQAEHIGHAITEFAESNGIDMIWMGDTGRSQLSQFLLGSVARYVLRNAVCSVWISRNATRS